MSTITVGFLRTVAAAARHAARLLEARPAPSAEQLDAR